MKTKLLSKSVLMRGMQCPKNLWLHIHKPELEPAADAATQFQFDEGNEVGDYARREFKGGVMVDAEYWAQEKAVLQTQDFIEKGHKVIFEAAFMYDGLFARADVLKKDKTGWHLIEVKKSTKVKDYHYQDAAIQIHIIEGTGLVLATVSIMHLNNAAIFPDLDDLFKMEDITTEVWGMLPFLLSTIKGLKSTVKKKTEPKVDIGPHCGDPFECPFKAHCWQTVPEKSVFDLPTMAGKIKWELFNKGKKAITSLDAKDYSGLVRRAVECTKSGKMYVDPKGIKNELKNWQWPLYFFDFETLGSAIPRYKKTKAYSAVPFQFSCHVGRDPALKKLEHFEYLHTKSSDPRPELINAMLKGFGKGGSIVAYNKSFEIGVIEKLADFDKKNAVALRALVDRFVDPLPIFRAHTYHPDFLGSFSIKTVAPAILGSKINYENLEIGDGFAAQAWAEQILRGKLKSPELDKIIQGLLTYCRQDTMAMVELVRWLYRV